MSINAHRSHNTVWHQVGDRRVAFLSDQSFEEFFVSTMYCLGGVLDAKPVRYCWWALCIFIPSHRLENGWRWFSDSNNGDWQ